MKTATGNSVLRAFNTAAGRIALDDAMTTTAESAGFIIPKGEKDGFQVFVKLVRYKDSKFKKQPISGGLLAPV